MQENFLLKADTAIKLYESVKDLPIIDYHNHLSLVDIANNKRFFDIYELWIQPDPYKHRAMRTCGVAEEYITGNATSEEKFIKWWETLPKLILNPLSHWSAMELQTIFGITEPLNGQNAQKIYQRCNEYLAKNPVTVNSLLELFQVEYACPCSSLIDDMQVYSQIACLSPSLRGDDMLLPTQDFLSVLATQTGNAITALSDYEQAIERRLDAFAKIGCRFTDHALDNGFTYYKDDGNNAERFLRHINGKANAEEQARLASYLLMRLGSLYAKRGFVMQLHIGAERYTSSSLRKKAGATGGFAGIGNSVNARALTELLDEIDSSKYGLPKTMLFTLNPADNALISVLSGSYAKDGVAGLITQGPAWWWCDHKFGMQEMLENTATFSTLSNFVGMTTDSRSLLSFVRHDYFRRVLCSWLAEKWENGEILCNFEALQDLAVQLSYQNAKAAIIGE